MHSASGFVLTGNPEITGWEAHLKAKEFRLELAHAGFPV